MVIWKSTQPFCSGLMLATVTCTKIKGKKHKRRMGETSIVRRNFVDSHIYQRWGRADYNRTDSYFWTDGKKLGDKSKKRSWLKVRNSHSRNIHKNCVRRMLTTQIAYDRAQWACAQRTVGRMNRVAKKITKIHTKYVTNNPFQDPFCPWFALGTCKNLQ